MTFFNDSWLVVSYLLNKVRIDSGACSGELKDVHYKCSIRASIEGDEGKLVLFPFLFILPIHHFGNRLKPFLAICIPQLDLIDNREGRVKGKKIWKREEGPTTVFTLSISISLDGKSMPPNWGVMLGLNFPSFQRTSKLDFPTPNSPTDTNLIIGLPDGRQGEKGVVWGVKNKGYPPLSDDNRLYFHWFLDDNEWSHYEANPCKSVSRFCIRLIKDGGGRQYAYLGSSLPEYHKGPQSGFHRISSSARMCNCLQTHESEQRSSGVNLLKIANKISAGNEMSDRAISWPLRAWRGNLSFSIARCGMNFYFANLLRNRNWSNNNKQEERQQYKKCGLNLRCRINK